MPRLAAFPKLYMNALCKDGTVSLREWVEQASELDVDGLEWYCGFLEMEDQSQWAPLRRLVEKKGMTIPMLCCSPDFTHPDEGFREEQVQREIEWIIMAAALGAKFCRVLSGQRRPEVSRQDGIRFAADAIRKCLPLAKEYGITLIIENHYKDDFWEYPEFAQKTDVFCDLVDRIEDPNFGVNYDPSNTFLAGEDPLELLRRISHRVVTMHASDRYLIEGTLDDLRREESGCEGYAKRLRHGQIGEGLNDYDAIFTELKTAGPGHEGPGFANNWISIEDGVDGMDQLAASVEFLRRKIAQHWG